MRCLPEGRRGTDAAHANDCPALASKGPLQHRSKRLWRGALPGMLMQLFHIDLRLVAAAYYAGEHVIGRRGLAYRNPDVVAYVSRIRATYLRQVESAAKLEKNTSERDVR